MDEMYLRRIVEKKIDQFSLVVLWGAIFGAYHLLNHYTPWNPWWCMVLLIPLFIVLKVMETSLREAICRQRGFCENPFRELKGVEDGRIGDRSRWLTRFRWVTVGLTFPFFIVAIVLVHGFDMKGAPPVSIILGIGLLIFITEPWWLDPIQQYALKRKGWGNLYTEKEPEVEDAPG